LTAKEDGIQKTELNGIWRQQMVKLSRMAEYLKNRRRRRRKNKNKSKNKNNKKKEKQEKIKRW